MTIGAGASGGADSSPPVGEQVDSILRTVWPAPSWVRYGTPRRTRRLAGTRREYIVVPGLHRPTLLVPRRPRRVAATVLRNYRTSGGAATRWKLRLMGAAARLGMADLLPGRVVVGGGGADLVLVDEYLRQALGTDLHLGVYLGPPRAVRKPILQVVTPAGRTLAFVKFGVNDYTNHLVRAETAVLSRLGSQPWEVLRVPRVLHSDTFQGCQVLVLEALERRRAASGAGTEAITRAMVELSRVGGTERAALLDSDYWRSLADRIAALSGPHADLLAAAHAALGASDRAQQAVLGFGSWHGDFGSWNLAVSGGSVLVWDWEFFASGVPLGFDAVHRIVQDDVVFGDRSPEDAFDGAMRRSAEILAPFDVAAPDAELTVVLYTLEIATRYLEDAEHSTRMADLEAWLRSTLAGLLAGLGTRLTAA